MSELPRRRVTEVWTWLPAFRAVAELQHVQHAAKALHVTPSSLSRAIRLLEEHVGRRLFDRIGRNIRLNHDGEEVLAAATDAMRRVDDALSFVTGSELRGELRVACEGDHPVDLAWRAASALMKSSADLTTCIENIDSKREVASRLHRGELDVALVTSAIADARLVSERIAEITYGIYCGKTHPLHGKRADLAAISKYPFVAPNSDDDGPGDQWPRERRRIVALRLPTLAAAIEACEGGTYLAVIPDAAATASLHRLPSGEIAPSSLFAIRRKELGAEKGKGAAFVAELRSARVTPPRGPRRTRGGPSRRAAR